MLSCPRLLLLASHTKEAKYLENDFKSLSVIVAAVRLLATHTAGMTTVVYHSSSVGEEKMRRSATIVKKTMELLVFFFFAPP